MTITFEACNFLVIESEDLDSTSIDKLKEILVQHELNSEGITVKKNTDRTSLSKSKFTKCSHIISNTIDFVEYEMVSTELMLPVVDSNWIYDSIKLDKLQSVRTYSPNPKYFFKEFLISCSSTIPEGDKEAICAGVHSLGGIYLETMTGKITHLISTDDDEEDCQVVKAFNEVTGTGTGHKIKLVLPEWIHACLKLNRRIDESPYCFPNPKILDSTSVGDSSFELRHDQNLAHLGNKSLDIGEGFSDIINDDEQIGNLIKFLDGKKFYFSKDLKLSKRMKNLILSILKSNTGADAIIDGGIKDLEKCEENGINCYVGHYRTGEEYQIASKHNLYIGNLNWIYWMFTHNKWSSPFSKLLHYPYPIETLPGMENIKVTLTNYTGDSRYYLRKLTEAMGGKFTSTMNEENTHLIVAKPYGRKYETSSEWNLKCVNHLWLEDSYAKWKLQDESLEKYTLFPKESNLTEIIAKTPIDMIVIKEVFLKEAIPILKEDEESVVESVGESIEESAGESVEGVLEKFETVSVIEEEVVDAIHMTEEHDIEGESENEVEEMADIVEESKVTPTPEPKKRSRKRKVTEKKEKKELTPVDDSEVSVEPIEITEEKSLIKSKKRKAKQITEKNNSDKENQTPVKKKLKESSVEPTSSIETTFSKPSQTTGKPYHLVALMTGCDHDLSTVDKRNLNKVGIKLVDRPIPTLNCIIAPSILRTVNFLKSLSLSPKYILSPIFISDVLGTLDTCKKFNDFEPVKPEIGKYNIGHSISFKQDHKIGELFEDSKNKSEISCVNKLIEQSNNKLFNDISISISNKIKGGYPVISDVIHSFGCKRIHPFEKRTKKLEGDSSVNYLLCTSSPDDKQLREHFKELLKNGEKYRIVEWDWVIRCIFNSRIVDNKHILEESK